jgi:hypothetical protein
MQAEEQDADGQRDAGIKLALEHHRHLVAQPVAQDAAASAPGIASVVMATRTASEGRRVHGRGSGQGQDTPCLRILMCCSLRPVSRRLDARQPPSRGCSMNSMPLPRWPAGSAEITKKFPENRTARLPRGKRAAEILRQCPVTDETRKTSVAHEERDRHRLGSNGHPNARHRITSFPGCQLTSLEHEFRSLSTSR